MTITLEQARKLCELGVRKRAEKRWYGEEIDGIVCWETERTKSYNVPSSDKPYAYNAEELFSMIEGGYDINVCEEKTAQVVAWYDVYQGCEYFRANTLTEALADKLIFDIENGIVTVEDVNK